MSVLTILTPEIIDFVIHLKRKESEIYSDYHIPTEDNEKGCPNLSSDKKILRYLHCLKIYDIPSFPLANRGFNIILSNAKKFLTYTEYTQFCSLMKKYKIGDQFK